MSSELWLLAEVAGISGVVSASVSFAYEQWRFRRERTVARQEKHLEYSVQNYPNFAGVLTDVVSALFFARNLYIWTLGKKRKKEFKEGLMNLVYWLGRLYAFEHEFRSKQGRMFRLGSQSGEILARHLYELGKGSMGLSRTQEIHLARVVSGKTFEEIKAVKDDSVVGEILEQIRLNVITKGYPEKFARKNFDTLSRLLIMEIEAIRLPGYE